MEEVSFLHINLQTVQKTLLFGLHSLPLLYFPQKRLQLTGVFLKQINTREICGFTCYQPLNPAGISVLWVFS